MYQVKHVTKEQAIEIFRKYGLDIFLWAGCSVRNGANQGMICDYTQLKDYTVAYACEIRTGEYGHQVERFNIMK